MVEKFFLHNFFAFSKNIAITGSNHLEIACTKRRVFELLFLLKNHEICNFSQLTDIVVHDRLSFKKRFNLTYILSSLSNNCRIFLSLQTAEGNPVFSIINLFECASWIEREVWDMFGVYVLGNNDFRRILCDYGFKGHPLRKDYPLSGYYELLFDDHYMQLAYFPIEFMQEFRVFEMRSTWGLQEII